MSSPKKRIVIVALIFAALSMLAVWRPDSRSIRSLIDAGGPPSAELGHESSVRTLAVDPGRSDRAWPVGIQRTYAVDFAYSIDFPEKKDDAVGATLHGRGMLELVALEDGDRSILRGALVGATVDVASTSGKKNGLLEIMPIQLARPFAVQLDHDLRIERVYFEPDLEPTSLAVLRFILGGAQFVRPASYKQADTWSVDETDSNGVATATYTRSGPERFTKLKRDYRDTTVEKSGRNPPPNIESSITCDVIPGLNVVQHAEIDELVNARLLDIVIAIETQASLTLRETEHVNASLDSAWLGRLRGMTLHEVIAVPTADDNTPLAANVTFDSTLQQIIATGGKDIDVADQLAKLYRQRPGAIDEAMNALRTRRDLPQEARTEIVAGFANANTDEGQKALLDVSRDGDMEPGLRNTAIMRLGMHEEPNAETMTGLQQMAAEAEGDDRATATLMLGSAARGAASNNAHAEVAQASLDFLHEKLAAAQTPAEQTLYLEALGNAGAASNMQTVAEAMKSETPSVRTSAVSALRFVKDPAAEAAMIQSAQTDPERDVRRESVASLVYRDFTDTTRDALHSVLRTDQEQTVRDEALAVISNYSDDPKVREQLEWTAKNDSSEDVRKRAQQVLDDTDGETAKADGPATDEPASDAPASDDPG